MKLTYKYVTVCKKYAGAVITEHMAGEGNGNYTVVSCVSTKGTLSVGVQNALPKEYPHMVPTTLRYTCVESTFYNPDVYRLVYF